MGNKKNRFYKDGVTLPNIGDVVIQNGKKVEVAQIRLAESGIFIDCSFDGKLCLDNPEYFDFVCRQSLTGNQ